MVVIRPTVFLANKLYLNLPQNHHPAKSTTKFGDWYATDFSVGDTELALFTSEHARFNVVVEIHPAHDFHKRFWKTVCRTLDSFGIDHGVIEQEAEEMEIYHFARRSDKSVSGCQARIKELFLSLLNQKKVKIDDLTFASKELNRYQQRALEGLAPFELVYELFGDARAPKRVRVTNQKPNLYIVKQNQETPA